MNVYLAQLWSIDDDGRHDEVLIREVYEDAGAARLMVTEAIRELYRLRHGYMATDDVIFAPHGPCGIWDRNYDDGDEEQGHRASYLKLDHMALQASVVRYQVHSGNGYDREAMKFRLGISELPRLTD